jgi:cyanophycinase
MDFLRKPIYLFADSQLLFVKENNVPFLHSARILIDVNEPKAAYIGASNGDDPDFYSIFVAAMEGIGIRDCRMIHSSFAPDDASFVAQADLVLLAGGDVVQGWKVIKQSGLLQYLIRKYYEGAVLIGISAGAMQLGLLGWPEVAELGPEDLFETLRLVDFVVSAHDEKNEWRSLRRALTLAGRNARGIGVPTGGGMAYYPDHSISPLRYPLHEFLIKDDQIVGSLLFPQPAEATYSRSSESLICLT